jgi:hypothetical protein
MPISKISRHLVAALLILTPATAFAGPLLGSSVTVTLIDAGSGNSTSGVAGTSSFQVTDAIGGVTQVAPTFTASTISLGFSTGFPSGAWYFVGPASFEVSGIDGDIVGASATGGGGSTTFTAHSVTLDLSDQLLSNGQSVVIDLDFGTAAPEPSALALFGSALVGLALLGTSVRRRNQT